jgi:uncharacterized protein
MPTSRPDPRSPLVFDTRTLGRQPGSARTETRVVPAPADLRVALAYVPPGADVKLDVLLEMMSDGVLATVEAAAPVTGECARCLEPVASSADVFFREFYEFDAAGDLSGRESRAAGRLSGGEGGDGESDDADRRFLDGNLLDLEPALRDAMVLALPLAPLCRGDCEGLCPECGVRLADAGTSHDHGDAADPRWARLRELSLGEVQDGARAAEKQEG